MNIFKVKVLTTSMLLECRVISSPNRDPRPLFMSAIEAAQANDGDIYIGIRPVKARGIVAVYFEWAG